jgi:hypothetical protein
MYLVLSSLADPSGCAVLSVILGPLACWNCGFESHRIHVLLSVASVVCCQVEVSATGRSLVQRSPTECGEPDCLIDTSAMRWPRVNRAEEKKSVFYDVCT